MAGKYYDDSLVLTDEEVSGRHAVRDLRRQFLEDLADTVAQPAGQRLVLTMLKRLGAERPVSADPAVVALRNEAESLLDDLAAASPTACVNVICGLRNIPR